MNVKTNSNDYPLNWLRWLLVIGLVSVGVWGNSFYDEYPLLYRVVALLFIAIIAVVIAVNTKQGSTIWLIIKESQVEVRKVVWPSRQETNQTTLVVIALVILMAFILWGLDSLFGWTASLIIG